MSERLRESLSALMDDEADDLELGRVLRAMDTDDGVVRDTWARYQAVSAVLRGLPIPARGDGFADVLANADLADDDATDDDGILYPRALDSEGPAADDEHGTGLLRAAAEGGGRGRVRPWLSFATAASVTLAAVLAFQYQGGDEAPAARVATAAGPSSPVMTDLSAVSQASLGSASGSANRAAQRPLSLRIPSPLGRGDAREPSTARRQVDAYMLYHAEMSALNSRSGMMPFARYAAFEGTPPRR